MTYVVQAWPASRYGWNEPYASDRVVAWTGRGSTWSAAKATVRLASWSALLTWTASRPARQFPSHFTVSGANAWPKKGCCCRYFGSPPSGWLGEQGPRFVLLLAVDRRLRHCAQDALFSPGGRTFPRLLPSRWRGFGVRLMRSIPLAVYQRPYTRSITYRYMWMNMLFGTDSRNEANGTCSPALMDGAGLLLPDIRQCQPVLCSRAGGRAVLAAGH